MKEEEPSGLTGLFGAFMGYFVGPNNNASAQKEEQDPDEDFKAPVPKEFDQVTAYCKYCGKIVKVVLLDDHETECEQQQSKNKVA